MATIETEDKLADAKRQGQAQFDSIQEMVEALRAAREMEQAYAGCGETEEKAREAIEQDALSVSVRSGWHSPGDKEGQKPEEYEILLCTGGPACRIVGTLNEHLEPATARLEVQDWFQPWTEYRPKVSEGDYDSEPILLEYVRVFWFGE